MNGRQMSGQTGENQTNAQTRWATEQTDRRLLPKQQKAVKVITAKTTSIYESPAESR